MENESDRERCHTVLAEAGVDQKRIAQILERVQEVCTYASVRFSSSLVSTPLRVVRSDCVLRRMPVLWPKPRTRRERLWRVRCSQAGRTHNRLKGRCIGFRFDMSGTRSDDPRVLPAQDDRAGLMLRGG